MELAVSVEVVEDRLIPAPGSADGLAGIVRFALAAEGKSGEWDITIALVSDDALRRLHADFLGSDTITDIMTFPRGGGESGGDIAISVDRAVEHAVDLGHSAWDEVCFLTVHGVLHLCGWNDGDDETRRRMLVRQGEILEDWSRS